MKRKASVTATLILACFLPWVGYSQGPLKGKGVEVNPIAATVNGSIITKNQVAVLVAPELRQLEVRFPPMGADFQRKALEAFEKRLAALVERRKLIDAAKPPAIVLRDEDVEARVKREIDEQHGGDREEFHRFLREHRTTLKSFRKFMHDELLEQAILRRQALGK